MQSHLFVMVNRIKKYYLAANLNVVVLVFDRDDFEVTTTLTVQSTPGFRSVIINILFDETVEILFE